MIIKNNDPFTQPSFTLSNRLKRFLWNAIWLSFFRPSPRPFHSWRSFLLSIFGAKIGAHVHIYPSVKIWAPWNLIVGDYVGIGDGCNVYSMDLISIGSYSVISQGTHLCSGSHDFNSSNFQLISSPIKIGENVWLCAESFVNPGVEIADGTVVGARSVVSKTVSQSWCVWAGVPIRKIGVRNKEKVFE